MSLCKEKAILKSNSSKITRSSIMSAPILHSSKPKKTLFRLIVKLSPPELTFIPWHFSTISREEKELSPGEAYSFFLRKIISVRLKKKSKFCSASMDINRRWTSPVFSTTYTPQVSNL